MAPEQLEGKEADARTDIFAFGAVLYEALSGRKAFPHPEPVSKRHPSIPPVFDHVLHRCLAKDPEDRWQTAHDLVAELRWIAEGIGRGVSEQPGAAHRRLWKLGWVVALAAGAAATWSWLNPAAVERPVIVSSLLAPEGSAYDLVRAREFIAWPALSPDGRHVVFGARSLDGRTTQLWVRALDSPTARPLAGTEAATFPFWSPDGRSVGFSTNADLTLKKVDLLGGPPVTITTLTSTLRGASWSPEGVIVYSQVGPTVQGRSLLMSVPHTGGESRPATARADLGPHRFPWFLPDGRHVLFVAQRESANVVLVGSLDDPATPGTVVAETETNVIYSQGHLLYVRSGTLMAQPFDVQNLETTGEAVAIADRVPGYLQPLSAALFSASASGLLVYPESTAGTSNSRLVWTDRSGRQIDSLDDAAGRVLDIQLSPDRARLLVSLQERNIFDLWIYEIAQRRRSRFTFNQDVEPNAVWTADGETVIWRTFEGDLNRKAATGGEDKTLFRGPGLTPRSVSPDGRALLYSRAGADIWVLPLTPDLPGTPLLPRAVRETTAAEDFAQFSPDGKWMAFTSDEHGRRDAYVRRYTGSGREWRVSSGGASHVRWSRNGRELFYVTPDGDFMAAEIMVRGETLTVGRVQRLFGGVTLPRAVPGTGSVRAGGTAGYLYDVSLDGQSFIVAQPGVDADGVRSPRLTLVENWTGLMKTSR